MFVTIPGVFNLQSQRSLCGELEFEAAIEREETRGAA